MGSGLVHLQLHHTCTVSSVHTSACIQHFASFAFSEKRCLHQRVSVQLHSMQIHPEKVVGDSMLGVMNTSPASSAADEARGDWGDLPRDVLERVGTVLKGQDLMAARLVSTTWRQGISWGVRCLRPRTVPNAGA